MIKMYIILSNTREFAHYNSHNNNDDDDNNYTIIVLPLVVFDHFYFFFPLDFSHATSGTIFSHRPCTNAILFTHVPASRTNISLVVV